MGTREDIKVLAAREATTLTNVMRKLYPDKDTRKVMSTLSQKLRNDTIKFREVREIADILGYDIKFEKRN